MKSCIFIILVCVLSFSAQAQTFFVSDLNKAINLAKVEKKEILIDFYTDWCAPCKRMSKYVFPEKRVGDYLNPRFVCIKLNAENEGKKMAEKFDVNAYPTFIVIDTNLQLKFSITGAMDADRFINSIRENIEKELSPERVKKRYESGDRTPKVVELYIRQLMRNGEYSKGKEIVKNYFNSLTYEEKIDKENIFIFLRYTIDRNSEEGIFFIDNIEKFDSTYKEQIEQRYQFLMRNR